MTTHDTTFETALANFLTKLTEREVAHTAEHFKYVQPSSFSTSPGGKRFVRVVVTRTGDSRSVYCFVERATGNIYKPAGWKAPTLNIVRGNIYTADPLHNTNPYGTNYAWDLS